MRVMTYSLMALLALGTPVLAGSHVGSGYLAKDLLSPCQEADNDARWGEAAETECEQYIVGFVDALHATGMAGPGTEICPPGQNTADEVRWAFMRWVHKDYSNRTVMTASEALMGTLKDNFACGG